MLGTSGFKHCFSLQRDDSSNAVVSVKNTVVITKEMIVEYCAKGQTALYNG